jgi:hypothetical protein
MELASGWKVARLRLIIRATILFAPQIRVPLIFKRYDRSNRISRLWGAQRAA